MNRREWMAGAGSLALAGCATRGAEAPEAAGRPEDPFAAGKLMADVESYVGFGTHRSGSPGDIATTEWFARCWRGLGYEIEHMEFDTPVADTTRAEVVVGGETIAGFAQPPLVFTAKEGARFQLHRWVEGQRSDVNTRIAYIELPTAANGGPAFAAARAATNAAALAGATGAIICMETPTGDPVANNTPIDMKATIPVLTVPWGVRAKVRAAAVRNELATLHIEGPGGVRKARNTIARSGKEGPWLIVSTPQSGWFTCGGERGPGIAISLALSAWAARKGFRNRLLFVATSGHEWVDAGAHLFHEHETPGPADTALWVHLGASFGSREYRQGPNGLEPLETAIPGCVFMASADMMDAAKAAFAGVPTLPPQPASIERSAGELTQVLKEGYRSSAGFFGYNAKFHTAGDGADSTTGAIMEPIARATAAMIEARLAKG